MKHKAKISQNCSRKRFKKYETISKLKSKNVAFSKEKCEEITTAFMDYYYISTLFYNNMFLQESIVFLAYPKNINDVEKAIEDHTLATNSCFLVYKTERGFN